MFDPWNTKNRGKLSSFLGVNTMYNALLNEPDFGKLDFPSLSTAIAAE
jgi:hypothetical protein